jgi:hypothetical protein
MKKSQLKLFAKRNVKLSDGMLKAISAGSALGKLDAMMMHSNNSPEAKAYRKKQEAAYNWWADYKISDGSGS